MDVESRQIVGSEKVKWKDFTKSANEEREEKSYIFGRETLKNGKIPNGEGVEASGPGNAK